MNGSFTFSMPLRRTNLNIGYTVAPSRVASASQCSSTNTLVQCPIRAPAELFTEFAVGSRGPTVSTNELSEMAKGPHSRCRRAFDGNFPGKIIDDDQAVIACLLPVLFAAQSRVICGRSANENRLLQRIIRVHRRHQWFNEQLESFSRASTNRIAAAVSKGVRLLMGPLQ